MSLVQFRRQLSETANPESPMVVGTHRKAHHAVERCSIRPLKREETASFGAYMPSAKPQSKNLDARKQSATKELRFLDREGFFNKIPITLSSVTTLPLATYR